MHGKHPMSMTQLIANNFRYRPSEILQVFTIPDIQVYANDIVYDRHNNEHLQCMHRDV